MKQDEMDDLLNKELSPDFNEQIPEYFLEDINSRLDQLEKKKKRRFFVIWFFSLTLIAGAMAMTYFFVDSNTEKTSSEIEKLKLHSKEEQVSRTINSKQNSFRNNAKENTSTGDKEVLNASNLFKVESSTCFKSKETNKTKKIEDDSELGLSIVKIESETDHEIVMNQPNQSFQNSELTVKLETNSNDDTLKSEQKNMVKSIDTAVIVKDSKLDLKSDKNKIDDKKRFSIGLFTGVSGVFSAINFNEGYPSLANSTEFKTYRETRRQQERMTSSWDLAMRIQLIQRKMTIQSGIEYFEWGEQLVYDYNSISGINRYSYLNVPFNVGYLFEKEKFGINPFVGVSFGYGIRRDGIYLNPDLISTSIVKSERFTSTFQTGAQFNYCLEQFTVSIIPVYRMSLGPVVNQGILRNSYKSVGLQMGLSYRF
jgi:hypothetical protein